MLHSMGRCIYFSCLPCIPPHSICFSLFGPPRTSNDQGTQAIYMGEQCPRGHRFPAVHGARNSQLRTTNSSLDVTGVGTYVSLCRLYTPGWPRWIFPTLGTALKSTTCLRRWLSGTLSFCRGVLELTSRAPVSTDRRMVLAFLGSIELKN